MAKKEEQGELIRDPSTYRAMSEPYATEQESSDALNAFFRELRELRIKHRIADTYTIASVSVIDASGEEGERITSGFNGSSAKALSMVAWAFGREQREHDALVRALAKGGS